jgi:hypothetical protein
VVLACSQHGPQIDQTGADSVAAAMRIKQAAAIPKRLLSHF